ncbi:MAG TPA: hypothetical protein VMZ30_19740 [Pyrinomonadaceae bacterium]|nr:hypothetical protein [Pyrinomonadaceae bacterium]
MSLLRENPRTVLRLPANVNSRFWVRAWFQGVLRFGESSSDMARRYIRDLLIRQSLGVGLDLHSRVI